MEWEEITRTSVMASVCGMLQEKIAVKNLGQEWDKKHVLKGDDLRNLAILHLLGSHAKYSSLCSVRN